MEGDLGHVQLRLAPVICLVSLRERDAALSLYLCADYDDDD